MASAGFAGRSTAERGCLRALLTRKRADIFEPIDRLRKKATRWEGASKEARLLCFFRGEPGAAHVTRRSLLSLTNRPLFLTRTKHTGTAAIDMGECAGEGSRVVWPTAC